MAEVAFHRKYRPKSIDEYMGDDIKRVVINRFKNENNYPQTILLYGPLGTGKTSMARHWPRVSLLIRLTEGLAVNVICA